MARFKPASSDPCEVPGCVRYTGKEMPGFCGRCFREMTEGERAQLMQARHAPFWKEDWRDRREPADDEFLIHTVGPPMGLELRLEPYSRSIAVTAYDGDGKKVWSQTWQRFLSQYEARTTQAAVAQAVADRLASIGYLHRATQGERA